MSDLKYYPSYPAQGYYKGPYQGPSVMAPPRKEPSFVEIQARDSGVFVVVDFKATCWAEQEKYKQEILEFSSELVDASTGHPKSSNPFHKFVIPTEHHILSEFCMTHNGIEQAKVEKLNGAVPLSEALQLHQDWIHAESQNSSSSAVPVVVTWGNWDCSTLEQECIRKALRIPDYFTRWVNLKTPFAGKYGNGYWKKPVKEALEATKELTWQGRATGGESHAHNKARLLALLIRQGANVAVTSWLHPAA